MPCLFILLDSVGLKPIALKIRHYLERRGFSRLSNVPYSDVDFLLSGMHANQTAGLICQFLLWLSAELGRGSEGLPEVFSVLAPFNISSLSSVLKWRLSDLHHKVYLGPSEFHWLEQNQPDFASYFRAPGDKGFYEWSWSHDSVLAINWDRMLWLDESMMLESPLQPRSVVGPAKSLKDAIWLARHVYGVLSPFWDAGLGGMSTLVSLAATKSPNNLRKGDQPNGAFTFFKLAVLRLKLTQDPESLANLASKRMIKINKINCVHWDKSSAKVRIELEALIPLSTRAVIERGTVFEIEGVHAEPLGATVTAANTTEHLVRSGEPCVADIAVVNIKPGSRTVSRPSRV